MNFRSILSKDADADIENILLRTLQDFGGSQLLIYAGLIERVISDLEEEPYNIASKSRNEIAKGARTYHLRHAGGNASHFILYRINVKLMQVEIGRVLHEKMDLKRHIPLNFK